MKTHEYHQILKYLYFEGYVDSYKEAEDLVEELSDDEFDFLYEEVFGIDNELNEKHVKALEPVADRRTRFPRFKGKESEFDPRFLRTRVGQKSSKVDPGFFGGGFKRRERKDVRRATVGGTSFKENYEYLISYLLDEGYADDLDSAYVILENMSEDWKSDVLKVTKKIAKKVGKSKFGKRVKKFAKYTALGGLGALVS